jgi:cell division protein ZapD
VAYVVGLTGGIGSGKSAVADAFARRGIDVVDTDEIARRLTAPGGAAMTRVRERFGSAFIAPDGSLDRSKMRDAVFRDPSQKERLEAIVHPLVWEEGARQVAASRSPYVIFVVPLLVETGVDPERYQRILVVDCDEDRQVERVMRRSGLAEADVRRIMAGQATRAQRLRAADDVLDNNGPLEALKPRIEELHRRYLALAGASGSAPRDTGLVQSFTDARESGRIASESRTGAPPVIVYEYPLNERMRTLLRLEDLFERVKFFLAREQPLEHHAALLTLFEILEVAGRADLKSDLIQELERQKQVLVSFRSNPDIEEEVLNQVLADIEQASQSLFAMTGKIGQYLRENEWLMSIKQRTGIPGGACEFDLPSYHYWLHRASAARLADLHAWISPLYPLRDGSSIVLRLLREGGKPGHHVAHQGAFSQMLGGKVAQMVRIRLPRDSHFIPEISANKYALNVRFTMFGVEPRPRLVDSEVKFELTFCNLQQHDARRKRTKSGRHWFARRQGEGRVLRHWNWGFKRGSGLLNQPARVETTRSGIFSRVGVRARGA